MNENINKNKIIFWIIWVVFVICIITIFFVLFQVSKKSNTTTNNSNFTIWTLYNKDSFNKYIDEFKSQNEKYKNTTFNIVSFINYDEYFNTLIWAFLSWKTPDMFVVNNNDSNFFIEQITGIHPDYINPDDFRKNHDIVFSQDLIQTIPVEDKEVEFLIWVPLWYEVLWIFYNFRELIWKNLSTWWYINEIIKENREIKNKATIWIWNWSKVSLVSQIITQFFLLDNIISLDQNTWNSNSIKSSLSSYVRFWDINDNNKFNNFLSWNKTDLDLFSAWEIQMVLWFPKMLEEIDKKWFKKNFLRAEKFPTYIENTWKLLINYNYFVINKNTLNYDLASELAVYFNSDIWQKKYLELFPYYFPSNITLLNDRLEENLKSWYSIKYKDFYNSNLELTTFNKKYRTIYDKEIISILDNSTNFVELFEIFRKRILCISNKMINQENLDKICN